jgi:single-strand DNA-binding protein
MNINRAILVGNLTRDPELRALPSGASVCKLGVAVNTRRKDATGEYVDKANFFDVTVFAGQAEACAKHLHKGSQVGIDGRLEWSSWEAQDGSKRSKVEIVADTVQFLGSRDESSGFQKRDESDVPSDFQSTRSNAPTFDDDDPPF